MKEQLMRQIIAKQDELLNIYSDYVIGNECEGFDWAKDFRNPANKCIAELAALKKQLKQAESEPKELVEIIEEEKCSRCKDISDELINWIKCV